MKQRLRTYDTAGAAVKFARSFDYARKFNGLPLLVVEQQQDGWVVVNPNPDAIPKPGRRPDIEPALDDELF